MKQHRHFVHFCKASWEWSEIGGSVNLTVTFGASGWFNQGGLALHTINLLYETSEELQNLDCDKRAKQTQMIDLPK